MKPEIKALAEELVLSQDDPTNGEWEAPELREALSGAGLDPERWEDLLEAVRAVAADQTESLHVTAIRGGGVYGHDCSATGMDDESAGCGGFKEFFYKHVDASAVKAGNVYEIDGAGKIVSEWE